ncbi:NAD(P)/FAD-dependent oxidoreductase [Clostridium sp. 001]|uniref:protoporphyrinogen/coproporphyrinogen oxidase n=1 Tax=Clostridium sp. 001 TaxID=1970093 RepID=UPI001C2C2FE5|nr:NAD(P)-binding protein [Clostridium sp. 001]QXE21287.1 hypothetical protein B5S50_16135 [Clostridium sp. 001]
MNKYVILGAGIAGICCGYFLDNKFVTIYEKDNEYGGLCGNIKVNKFIFDKAVHLSFTKSHIVRSIFDKTPYNKFNPQPYNYYKGLWIRHPIQNNLYQLSIEDRIKCIKSFLERSNTKKEFSNYEEWLYNQYGKYISDKFPKIYTRKYWCTEASQLGTGWINNRMYRPSIDEILYGAMSDKTENVYYAKEMRYPKQGGYKSFLNPMVNNINIKLNKKAILIDATNKYIEFKDGTKVYYETLISSIPVPELIGILKDTPREVIYASNKLMATSMKLVSVGFNRPDIIDKLWFYIYDEDILPARAYSPSLKSRNNVPNGCSSIQFEIYESPCKKVNMSNSNLCEYIEKCIIKMNIASKNDILFMNVKNVDYANVIFYSDIYRNREIIQGYLKKVGIYCIGRFGKWDYLWSDQSFLSGMNMAIKLKNEAGIY